MTLFNIYINE